MKRPALLFVLILGLGAAASAEEWQPKLDPNNKVTHANDGRTIERYTHGPRVTWGYPESAASEWEYKPGEETGPPQQNHSSFYVVSPKQSRAGAPLCVVLHSANRTAYDYLGFACLGRQIENHEDPTTVMTNSPDDFYSLYLSSTNAEWWGWSQARENRAEHRDAPPPAELRVLDTIDWVATRYQIDRQRIYLCGVSMGGCGTLGIGMPHGEVFAAIRAEVPAGTNYASYRMGGFAPSPATDAPQGERDAWIKRAAAVGRTDPPVIVDFSSQQDNWAMTQPALVQAAQAGRLPLVLSWGPFGHATFGSLIAKYPLCEVALAYPWLEIRRDEAYPVFTRASCDQISPWLNAPVEYDNTGQSNAYFRWKNVQDTPKRIVMQLWIAHPTLKEKIGKPEAATADVTLRRLKGFKVTPGVSYPWEITQNGQTVASGKVATDLTNLLTIPQVPLRTMPVELTITAPE